MDENQLFSNSNNNLSEEANYGQPAIIVEPENQYPIPAPTDNGSGNNKKIIIIAVVAVAVIAALVAVIFIVRGAKKDKEPENEPSEPAIGFFDDLTKSDGSFLTDEEISSRIAEERDPEILSILAEATTKFSAEIGTGSSNMITPATKAPAAATTTSANGSNKGAASTTAANSANKNSASTTAANGGNQSASATTSANGGNQGAASTTSASAPTTSASGGNTADKKQADAAVTQITAFYDRKFYFEGKMFENGEGNPMSMAFDGDNYEVYTQLDGIEISIMKKNGKIYMKRPATKQYVELNDSLMSMLGLSMDDININLGSKDFNSMTPDSVYDVTINGKPGVCYQYKPDGGGYSEFYAVDGQLKEIDIKDNNFNTQTQLQIDVFSTSIPSDQLNLNGYTQAKSLFSMISDMM